MDPIAFLKHMRTIALLVGIPAGIFAVILSRRYDPQWREAIALIVVCVVMLCIWLYARRIDVQCPRCLGNMKVSRIYPTITYRCKECGHTVDTDMWA